jgi:hypothetical protein
MPWRDATPLASTPTCVQVAGLGSLPTPWLRGRPSPTWGHARFRRDRRRRVPTQLSGGPAPQQQADHRTVASLLNVTCSYADRKARRAPRNAPHQRQFPNRAPDQPQRGTPTRVPDGEAHPWPPPTCPAHHRPTNARASRNRANPANPRPQTAAVPSTSKVCTAVRSGLPARGLGAATAATAALPASGSPARRGGRPRHAARCPPRSRSARG